jgi:5-methylcytosine-specific restriction endonuclease McrA
MRPVKNLISVDMRFGCLTVVCEAGYNSYGCRMFDCRCDCGEVARLRATHLYQSRRYCSRSCALLSWQRVADLTGNRFGRWLVKSLAHTDDRGDAVWECTCDCGTVKAIRGFMLANGSSKSCGCSIEDRIIYKTPEEKLASKRRHSRVSAAKYPARRKAGKIKYETKRSRATPDWLSQDHWDAMDALYLQARAISQSTGVRHEVDHILPLNGKTVSGLHVPWNLQILTQSANVSKSNRYAEHLGD